jgi:hypothetical protein
MRSFGRNAPSGQPGGEIPQKRRRAADIKIRLAAHAQLLQRFHFQAPESIEVHPWLVIWKRSAESDVTAAVG